MPKINDDNLYQKSNELDRKEEILNRKYLYLKETTGILYQEHLISSIIHFDFFCLLII